jgi:membrane fusion protein (multidrug efflux system)
MKVLKPIVVVSAAIVVVLVAHHFIRRSEPPRRRMGGETPVVVQTVELRSFYERTEAIGTISANESVLVTPAVSDRVSRILFEDGAHVKEGDVLVELEHSEESAALEEARVNLDEEQRESDRVETLREQNLVSQEEMDLAQGNLEAARARLTAAEARVNDRIIKAPFDGVLGIRRVSPGALVSPGSVITTLDDLSTVKVDFTVPEAVLSELALGQSVEGRAAPWPDETFRGTVTGIDSRVDRVTRAVGVQARIPNPNGKLRAGMLLTVELTSRTRVSPAVPERALLSFADKQYVYVVREDQTVEQREIVLGIRDVGWVEVLSGLEPGETIVVDGLLNLRDGAPVKVETEAPEADRDTAEPDHVAVEDAREAG